MFVWDPSGAGPLTDVAAWQLRHPGVSISAGLVSEFSPDGASVLKSEEGNCSGAELLPR